MAKAKEKAPAFRSEAQRSLAERERLITEQHHGQGVDVGLEMVANDRRARWTLLLDGREESSGIREWAAHMASLHGPAGRPQPEVQVWRNRLPWITALYVVRYGEAEDFWPAALTDDDLRRAREWLRGEHPKGVRYLTREA